MITLRPLKPEEWQIFQKLNNEIFEDNSQYDADLIVEWAFTPVGEKYFKEHLADPKCITFVAEDEGNAVGYIACAPREFSYRHKKYLEIDNMGVSPSHRSMGVGSMLISKAKEWAKVQRYDRIFVTAYHDNISGCNFYKKNGAKEIDTSFDIEL